MTTGDEELLKRATARPDVLNGKPIIRDMRIYVELILSLLSQRASLEELMEDYPELEEEDIVGKMYPASGGDGILYGGSTICLSSAGVNT